MELQFKQHFICVVDKNTENILLLDVTPLSLGIEPLVVMTNLIDRIHYTNKKRATFSTYAIINGSYYTSI